MKRRRAPNVFVCEAGGHHFDTPAKVARWEAARLNRLDEESRRKVQAHDDYMAGMALFRERMPSRIDVQDRRNVGGLEPDQWFDGYEAAIRDMDRALLDVVRAHQQEETDDRG